MARRKRSRSRRSFAARTRTVYRTVRAKTRRAYRGARKSGWLPLSGRETITAFGVGAVTPMVNSYVAPYTDGVLGVFGDYKDEARTALIGVVAHKFGSGIIKDAGREMFRYAVLSAGQQAGGEFTGKMTGGSGLGGQLIYA